MQFHMPFAKLAVHSPQSPAHRCREPLRAVYHTFAQPQSPTLNSGDSTG